MQNDKIKKITEALFQADCFIQADSPSRDGKVELRYYLDAGNVDREEAIDDMIVFVKKGFNVKISHGTDTATITIDKDNLINYFIE